MEETKFKILLNAMKVLEQEDAKRSSLEIGIIKVMDAFDEHLTEDQKKILLGEFAHYEKSKKSAEESRRMKAVLQDQEYKDLFRRPLEDDENLGY
ncbi:MAG: hypothetical protein HYT72_04600 [Candidatus Aenigmarchaeota archaeon]|nr:hypothetical protein [Candidatus Aenigmarchaeota archaeon]